MDSITNIEKHMVLKHSVTINTSSDRIWNFLTGIDKNYKDWHPDDHILFCWTKGEAMETGSTFYAEQYMTGHKIKYRGYIAESVPSRKITMKFLFPLSLVTEKIEMIVGKNDSYSTFTHITYLRFMLLSRTLFKKHNLEMLNDMQKHVITEGQNMKTILEKQNSKPNK